MFTVKATHRGQVRKYTFPKNTFPTYDEICVQLFRVFLIEHDIHLSKVVFSPDASTAARILLSREITDDASYRRVIQPYAQRTWANACLRFHVHDVQSTLPTLRTQPSVPLVPLQPSVRRGNSVSARPTPTPRSSERPVSMPSAPFGLPGSSSQIRVNANETPAQHVCSRAENATASGTSSQQPCCQVSEAKAEIHALLASFQENMTKVLSENFGPSISDGGSGMATPTAATPAGLPVNDAPMSPPPPTCSVCARNPLEASTHGYHYCRDCHTVICGVCHDSTRPGFCLTKLGSHSMIRASSRDSFLPIPQLPPCTPAWAQGPSENATSSRAAVPDVGAAATEPNGVLHPDILCDQCNNLVYGVRHKCLDCPDFDLCSTCIEAGSANAHNPFHAFFEIREPGRVIVHNVYSGDGERDDPPALRHAIRSSTATTEPPESEQSARPIVHLANCDLCASRIHGPRYKCLQCPDFDTCSSCFSITAEQHPHHSFVKIDNRENYIQRIPETAHGRALHYATCDECNKPIYGVRYKCMDRACPDFDLCEVCEAHPIPVHPPLHPLLKIKNPDTVIPTVLRVGASEPTSAATPTPSGPEGTRQDSPSHLPAIPVMIPEPVPAPKVASPPSPNPAPTFPIPQEMMQSVPSSWPASFAHLQGLPTILASEGASTWVPPPPPPPLPGVSFQVNPQPPMKIPGAFPAASVPVQMPAPVDIIPERRIELTKAEENVRVTKAEDDEEGVKEHFGGIHPWPATNFAEERELLGLIEQFNPIKIRDEEEARAVFPSPDLSHLIQEPWASVSAPEASDGPAFVAPSVRHLLDEPQEEVEVEAGSALASSLLEVPKEKARIVKVESEEMTPVQVRNPFLDALSPVSLGLNFGSQVSESSSRTVTRPALSATFVEDVTVQDGQVLPPGAEFVKIWKVFNDSGREWPANTELVWVAGESFANNKSGSDKKQDKEELVAAVGTVLPGEEVDVWSCELKAPEAPGRFVGYWRLKADGEVFGCHLWIEVNVSDESGSGSGDSMSSSSVIMPTPGEGTGVVALPDETVATSASGVPSTTVGTGTVASTGTAGSVGSLGDDVSIVSLSSDSDDDEALWHETRSRVTGMSSAANTTDAEAPAGTGDFVVLYDSD